MLSHRFAWWVTHNFEPIPANLIIAHTCDGGAWGCCNPKHLECVSQQKNTRDAIDRGLLDYSHPNHVASRQRAGASVKTRYHGSTSHNSKLTSEQVDEMRQLYATGEYRQIDLAAKYGLGQSHVSRILLKKSRAIA
jgi:hypothetical protein